ncbi:[Ribosomal protein S18]-alanine N-acetyltransferase [Rubrobacter xylanophilus DSM 9941]|uniref:ribosomal protein S18-alanine N-acetyltransferase n=1 Tax=Rubrobacter xylanophilus TaxID=49319 RepID=UPI001C640908|nr:ribosomal protein S18-alanine N-acetyltransferase [Rubrobacter xylanophilus]QYJ17010.1 [Ribosomal protein S18]-alanine N-acetyltransferase [Rubrobacter xylanophilus DSM 9941]
MKIRRMRPEDLPAVMEIEALSLPTPWSEGVWRQELSSSFGLYLVLEEGGRVRGQIGARRAADELHVTTLAVHPACRRRGYGRTLLRAAVAEERGIRRVLLEVRPSNAQARAFYAALGFHETGRRPRYYGDEDALLMTLDLPGAAAAPPAGA